MRSQRFSARDERGVVVPSRLMLVTIVVVVAAAAMYVATTPGQRAAREVASSSTSTSASAAPSASSPSASSPAASASPSPTWLSTSPTPTTSATPKAASSPSASASVSAPAGQTVRRAATFVEVFNNTKRKGLAGRTARKAEGVGWKVVGSDNWYGTIPSSTVYYPRSYSRAARALARDLGISRVEPAVAPMRNDRLTVILTSDYRAR